MSNDLISRSEVLKTLEYVFNKYRMSWDKHGGFAKEVPEAIRNLPTAYDADWVVQQIKQNSKDIAIIYPTDQGYDYDYADGIELSKTIEIVKAGGIES